MTLSSSTALLSGVDPELYELTTSKLDPGSSSSRVADAFARLMSTMEKTSTSTRSEVTELFKPDVCFCIPASVNSTTAGGVVQRQVSVLGSIYLSAPNIT